MIFDNTSETSSYTVSREEMEKNFDVSWYLWRLKAQDENDVKDFSRFASLMKKAGSGSLPLSSLNEWGIGIHQSRIIRNLIREKLAQTTDKEIKLVFPVIDNSNLEQYKSRITEYYQTAGHKDNLDLQPFPSSYFCLIEKNICRTVTIQNLGWQSFESDEYQNKLLEIVFSRFHIPPVLTTPECLSELIDCAREKIILRLSRASGEDNEFFSRYIKFEGFSIKNRFPNLFENDLIPIKNKKGQDYQYGYARIFLEKVFAKPESAAEYMNAINFEAYSDLGVRFSPSKKENYDFIQSYLIYKELALPQTGNKQSALKKVTDTLLGCLRFYMTENEIKEQILLTMPDVNKEFHEKIFHDFKEAAIEEEKQQKNFTVLYFTVDFFGSQETIYIHAANFNRYLNKTLNEVSEPMEKQIRDSWKEKLLKYRFSPEMFSLSDFNDLIYEMIKRRDSILYQILKQKKCLFYLTKLKNLNQYCNKLILFGPDNLAEVFKLKPEKIYSRLVEEIKKEKSFFGRLIFSFFNWYYLRAYRNTPAHRQSEKKKKVTGDESDSSALLSSIGVKKISQIDEKCDLLWSELGADQIPRKALENNIKNDLLEYFKNRERVALSGLQILIERNSNRIIKQAPHLAVYQEKLNEFIRLYAYKIIITNSSLRSRFQPS